MLLESIHEETVHKANSEELTKLLNSSSCSKSVQLLSNLDYWVTLFCTLAYRHRCQDDCRKNKRPLLSLLGLSLGDQTHTSCHLVSMQNPQIV